MNKDLMMLAGIVLGFGALVLGLKKTKRVAPRSPITYSKQGKLLVIMAGGNA